MERRKSGLLILLLIHFIATINAKDKLFGTKQIYLIQFGLENSRHSEIQYVKKIFSSLKSSISREEYIKVIVDHMNGIAHNRPLAEEIMEAVNKQMKKYSEAYLSTENVKERYTVQDVYDDIISTRFQDWFQYEFPDTNHRVEPLEPEELYEDDI